MQKAYCLFFYLTHIDRPVASVKPAYKQVGGRLRGSRSLRPQKREVCSPHEEQNALLFTCWILEKPQNRIAQAILYCSMLYSSSRRSMKISATLSKSSSSSMVTKYSSPSSSSTCIITSSPSY